MTEPETPETPQKLTRSRDDRYIGGVAAGIAERFSIDPALVRIAFVLSLAFGGFGAIAYLILLVMLPIGGDPSEPVEPVKEGRRIAVIAGTVLLGLIFVITRGSGGWLFGIGPGPLFGIVFWGLAIAGLIWLIREGTKGNPPESFNDRPSPSSAPSPSQTAPARVAPLAKTPEAGDPAEAPTEVTGTAAADTAVTEVAGISAGAGPGTAAPTPSATARTGSTPSPQAVAEGQERSGGAAVGKIMTWFAIGLATLVGLFIVASISAWVTVLAGAIPMAIVLVGLGAAMVVLAITERSRIAIWLLPVALFVAIPMAVLSLAGIRLEGGYGDFKEKPVVAAEIPSDGYQMAAGQMTIDMRRFNFRSGSTVELPVDSGLGYTQVIVPDDVCVSADIDGKAGLADIRGTRTSGVDISRTIVAPESSTAPGLHVNGDFQLGFLQVVDSTSYESRNYIGGADYDGPNEDDWDDQSDKKAVARAEAACEVPAGSGDSQKGGPGSKKSTTVPGETTKS